MQYRLKPSESNLELVPRVPWARGVFFALLTAMFIAETVAGVVPLALGCAAAIVLGFLSFISLVDPPAPIVCDGLGVSVLRMPRISWADVTDVRVKVLSTPYPLPTRTWVLVLAVRDRDRLAAPRMDRAWPRTLNPLRRLAEHRRPELVTVTLPRRFAKQVEAFIAERTGKPVRES